jgi:hypothetical protein
MTVFDKHLLTSHIRPAKKGQKCLVPIGSKG